MALFLCVFLPVVLIKRSCIAVFLSIKWKIKNYIAHSSFWTCYWKHTCFFVWPNNSVVIDFFFHNFISQFMKDHKVDWTNGRANDDDQDLNRDFPNIDDKFFQNREKKNGRSHHLNVAKDDMVRTNLTTKQSKSPTRSLPSWLPFIAEDLFIWWLHATVYLKLKSSGEMNVKSTICIYNVSSISKKILNTFYMCCWDSFL